MIKSNLRKGKTVSIILPTYNSLNTIQRCLKSVIQQKSEYKIEIIIIDDNSNDGTKNFIRNIKLENQDQIKIIENKKNMGVGYCRQKGIEKSSGSYVAFIDSDDYWLENKLLKQIYFMETNNIQFSFSEYLVETKNDKENFFHIDIKSTISIDQNKYVNNIPNSTVVISNYLAKKYKYPCIRLRNDFLYWNTIMKKENIKAYNIDPGKGYAIYGCTKGISSKKTKLIYHQWKLYRKHFKYSRLDSFRGIFFNILINFRRSIITSKVNQNNMDLN